MVRSRQFLLGLVKPRQFGLGGRDRAVRRADATAFNRVEGHSPTLSQRRTAAPLPPAIQRWAEGRNPFRIEAAGGGHEVRTRQLWAALQRASSRDGRGASVAPPVHPLSALSFR